MLRAWNDRLLLLPNGLRAVLISGNTRSSWRLVITVLRRGVKMKVVILEKRKGFWGFILRKIYGVRKVEEV